MGSRLDGDHRREDQEGDSNCAVRGDVLRSAVSSVSEELMEDWNLARRQQPLKRIAPLE